MQWYPSLILVARLSELVAPVRIPVSELVSSLGRDYLRICSPTPTSWPEAVSQLTMCARDPPLPELGYHSVAKSPPLNSYKVSLNSLDTPPSFTQGGSVSPPSFAN